MAAFRLGIAFLLILIIIGLFPVPNEYFMFLRLYVFVVSIHGLIISISKFGKINPLIIGIIVLYNPIIPIYLYSKIIWIIFNVVTLVVLANVVFGVEREKEVISK